MKIKIEQIHIESGTQQRPIDEDVVQQYMTLMEDGIEFPPVEVVSDGKNYWLWDGFHRYRCAKKLNQKTIEANIAKGQLRDAIWLSFSANKAHGLSRQKGVARQIIERILIDKTWSRKSLSAIARHVGVTQQYVTKIKERILAQDTTGCTIEVDSESENGDSGPETSQSTGTCTLLRDTEVEVERKGTTYTQKSQEKQHRTDEPLKDSVGRVIPEHLREIYTGRSVIWGMVSNLAHIRDTVIKHVDNADPLFSLLNTNRFQVDYENFRRTLKSAMPYAVCVYCGGDAKDCKACKGFGLLNKNTYDSAPKEMKR